MARAFTSEIFSSSYKDDFIDSDNYHRVLFNSGRALQARELTQLQTIIQTEVGRLGRHLFKEGASVNPGGVTSNTEYEFIKLDTSTNPLPADTSTLIGNVLEASTGSVKFRVLEVVAATGSDPATLYGTYTDTSSAAPSGSAPVRVSPGDTLTGVQTLTVQSTNTTANPAVGQGCKVSIHAGDFFAQDHFVFSPEQSLIVSKYTNTPSVDIGFKVTQDIVTSSDDAALFDNQGATPNLSSPGADRYRIRLTISTRDLIDSDENFIEVAKIKDGVITAQVTAIDSYNQIDNVLARRTKEESGDYIVKPFDLQFQTNDSDNTKLDFIISSGTAYVDGYRAAKGGDTIITLPKPQTLKSLNNQVVSASYGNYIIVNSGSQKGIPNVNTLEELNLRNATTHGGSTIGTARIRHILEEGNGTHYFYLFKIEMNSGQNFADVKSIGTSATNYWDLVLENSKAVLKEPSANGLLFDLPIVRPSKDGLSDVSYTAQRLFSDQTDGSGDVDISVTSGEAFTDASLWLTGPPDDAIDATTVTINDPPTSASIAGGDPNENPYEIVAYVSKTASSVRQKSLATNTETITPDGSTGQCVLAKPDIYQVTVIKETNSSGEDRSAIYEVDNGQTDEYYGLGKLNLIAGNTAPSAVYVEYSYFTHGASGDFFAVNSYTGQVDYEDIPDYTKNDGSVINLRNVLDFRPVVNSSGNFGSGAVINELPRPTGLIQFDASFYQGQGVKVAIDTQSNVKLIRGIPDVDPKLPKSPENALDLFNVTMNPYVVNDQDVKTETLSYKRFTMADIGKLEQRVSDLEETTALSLLELETNSFEIYDSSGLSRNKSGFYVDNFADQQRSFVRHPDYSASIDPSRKRLRPSFENRNVNLFYNSSHSDNSNVIKKGDNIYLSYSEVSYLKNDFVTGWENVNPFAVVTKQGFMELSPASDEWYETVFTDPIVIDGGFEQGNINGNIWDDWSFNWSGAENIEVGQQLGESTISEVQLGNTVREGNNNVTPRFQTERAVKVAGVRTKTEFIDEEGVEVNRTFRPFMRSRKVFFKAQGLKPTTRHWPFFSNKDVSSWVKQETFQRISDTDSDYSTGYNAITQHPDGPTASLVTDAEGTLQGSFFLPHTDAIKFASGDRTFTLIDVSVNDEDACTSIASAKYYSQGITIHRQQTVLSTRIVDLDVAATRIDLDPLVEQRRRGKDPLAQSFIVEDIEGVFITNIKVRFKSLPAVGNSSPVVAQLRPMVNGVPSADNIVPGSTVFKTRTGCVKSDDASAITTFAFDEPVYLTGNEEYCIVLLSDSNEFEVFVAEAGAFLLGSTEKKLSKQATLGSLFKSQNARTWEPDQTKDLTFELTRASFNTSGVAVLENSSPGKVNVTNAIKTVNSSSTVTVNLPGHGFVVGDDVEITGAQAVGGIAANHINTGGSSPASREVTAVDHDNFKFVAGATATSSTTGGGAFTVDRQNMFETMMLKVENILPPTTTLNASAKLTSGKSIAGTETAYQKETSYAAYPVNRNIYFDAPKLLSTDRNSTAQSLTGNKAATIKLAMTSVSNKVSPVIDMQRTSISTIHNRIGKDSVAAPFTSAAETSARGGSELSKHLTKPVTLGDKAKGLKIMLSANKPSRAEFDVYYRTNSGGLLLDQDFVLIAPEVSMPSDDNPNVYRDYRYLPGNIGGNLPDFDQFQIKIVMKSTNSAQVPKFADMRVIALTV